MRVLVIGGTRFMGPRLVRALAERGHAVTTFNRGCTHHPREDGVERLHGDRSDRLQLERALEGRSFDACVDTIAMRGGDTASAIDLLDGRVGHYVHFSTGQVYLVRADRPSPAREEDYEGSLRPPPPIGAWDAGQWSYGIEKRECEDLLEQAWATRAFPATRLRLTMVHGKGDPQERIRAYVLRLLEGGPLAVPAEPGPPIRPIHASAVVQTVVRLIEEGMGRSRAYNLAQAESWSHDELVARIAEMLGTQAEIARLPQKTLIDAGVYPACAPLSNTWMSVLDPARAAAELGFEPGRFEDWLPELVERLIALPAPQGFEELRAREIALVR